MENELPKIAYATFAGSIDQQTLPKIYQGFAGATQTGIGAVHLLFQSTGGMIGDGVSLYNFFCSLPIELHLYNTGSVQSIAVLAYLGAKHRHTSAHATFMIHKSHFPAQLGTNACKMKALSDALGMEDTRIEAILKSETKIPLDKWE